MRSKSLTTAIDIDMLVISHAGGRLKSYFFSTIETLIIVCREKPDVVFAPNPSIVLTYILLLVKIFLGFKFISDSHWGGITAFNGNYYLQKALNICNRSADLVLVTNKLHADFVESIGGSALVYEDPLPDLSKYKTEIDTLDKSVLFICSYDIDEPYHSTFEAARILVKDGFKFYASGNYSKIGINPNDYEHVIFLGFVSEDLFYDRLFKSDVVIDLTEYDNCLVCGAYEAMSAERPLVTSDRPCLREYFDRGTIFTQHDSQSIAEAVRRAYLERHNLVKEIREWKLLKSILQAERRSKLLRELCILC